jgi:signal peptidase II
METSKTKRELQLLYVATFIPLILTWTIDHFTKKAASGFNSSSISFFGPVGFIFRQNYGLVTGLYSESSPLLREVSLATVAGFLLFIYFMIQYLLPTRNLMFRSGLSFLMGGILGNVTDRMVHGSVTDFITLGNASYYTSIFNCADALQWVGYVLVIYSVTRKWDTLWRVEELRQSYCVNPKFQLSYCLNLVACGLGFAIISGAFTFTYFKIAIGGASFKILVSYLLVFSLVTLAFLILLFILGMIISHRIAGPIYAFERFLKELQEGQSPSFKLRSKDQFMHLEELAAQLKEVLGRTDYK